ncbi:MAG TPA: twin transmembrane helix small protein [Rhizomicrobium sp.]|jgi:hypothetical protein|nr:twin transmembrane helix small protein [Rhizomicrobium sp.]
MGGKVLVIVAIGFVAVVLMGGIYTLWAGGEVSRTWSNKLMRLRIVAQFVAVIIIMAVLWFTQH